MGTRALHGVDALPLSRTLPVLILVQWLLVLGIALSVTHNGWVYYQGGDQLWYSTSGWLLGHGLVPQPLVGYLWTALMAPLALVGGPDLANWLPAIVALNVVILLPVLLLSLFGLARIIGGLRFAYATVVAWLAIPFVGITLTNTGYHQRYTELLLPQGFGLTAMADFPTMVAAVVAAYFVARAMYERHDPLLALGGGIAAGVALGIKPATALFLAGPLLGFVAVRRFRALGIFVLGMLPAVAALGVWKWRGYGYLPLLHADSGTHEAAAAGAVSVNRLPNYFQFDWTHFVTQLDLLREHFWSARLIEWLVVAGAIALWRRSASALALVGGWFAAFVIGKGGYSNASIEDGSLLRILIPAYPAFVILVASLPFLAPGRRRVTPSPTRTRIPRRRGLVLAGASVALTAVAPAIAIAASAPMRGAPGAAVIQTPLIPVSVPLGVTAAAQGSDVVLRWRPQRPAGGAVFYHVYRLRGTTEFGCWPGFPAEQCSYHPVDLGTTRATSFRTRAARGTWTYRVGVSTNWENDTTQGDVYLVSNAATVTIR